MDRAPHIPYFVHLAILAGLILGSFYNLCVTRYQTGESIVLPRSKCPACGHKLAWWELVPLAGYLLLRGRCSACRKPIGLRYPALELASAAWAGGLAARHGPSWAWLALMAVGGVLLVAAFIDLETFLLPDRLTLPGAALALATAVLVLGMPLRDSLLGAGAGAGFFWLLQQGYRLVRRAEGLGTGDVKLMLLLGALLGWQALPMLVTLAALLALAGGILFIRRSQGPAMQTPVPFGPFLAAAGMAMVLFGDVFRALASA